MIDQGQVKEVLRRGKRIYSDKQEVFDGAIQQASLHRLLSIQTDFLTSVLESLQTAAETSEKAQRLLERVGCDVEELIEVVHEQQAHLKAGDLDTVEELWSREQTLNDDIRDNLDSSPASSSSIVKAIGVLLVLIALQGCVSIQPEMPDLQGVGHDVVHVDHVVAALR